MTTPEESGQQEREDSMWQDYLAEQAELRAISLQEKYPYNFSTGDPE